MEGDGRPSGEAADWDSGELRGVQSAALSRSSCVILGKCASVPHRGSGLPGVLGGGKLWTLRCSDTTGSELHEPGLTVQMSLPEG